MKIKCIVCGRRLKPKQRKRCSKCQQEVELQAHRRYWNSQKGQENARKYYEENKEHILKRNREWRKKNKESLKEWHRKYRETHKEKIRQHRLEYYQKNKEKLRLHQALRNQISPFHYHDITNNLSIVNGRVKGAVWLENQICKKSVMKNYWRRSFYQRQYQDALCSCSRLQTPFFVAVENNSLYCVECGGRIIKAFENDYYTKLDLCCEFCGLVLPQT